MTVLRRSRSGLPAYVHVLPLGATFPCDVCAEPLEFPAARQLDVDLHDDGVTVMLCAACAGGLAAALVAP